MGSNAEVVREFLDATSKGDLDGISERIAEDAVFHIPGRNKMSGELKGHDTVVAFFGRIIEMAGGRMETDVHDILASDDHVVALVTRTIAGVRAPAAVVYHLEDGRIASAWPHEADQHAVDEAIGS